MFQRVISVIGCMMILNMLVSATQLSIDVTPGHKAASKTEELKAFFRQWLHEGPVKYRMLWL